MNDLTNLIGVCLGVFVVCVLVASSLTRRALRCLSDPDRATLVKVASQSSMVNLAVPFLIALGYCIVVFMDRKWLPVATVIALGFLLVHGIVSACLADRLYRANAMPRDFLKFFRMARGVRIFGALFLFTGITIWLLYSWLPQQEAGNHWHEGAGASTTSPTDGGENQP